MKPVQITRGQKKGISLGLFLLSGVLAGASATNAFADTPASCSFSVSGGQVTLSYSGVSVDQSGANTPVYANWLDYVDMGTWTDIIYHQVATPYQGNTLPPGTGGSGSYSFNLPAGAEGFSIWTALGDDICDGSTGESTSTTTSTTTTTEPPTTEPPTTEPPTTEPPTTEPPTTEPPTTEPPTTEPPTTAPPTTAPPTTAPPTTAPPTTAPPTTAPPTTAPPTTAPPTTAPPTTAPPTTAPPTTAPPTTAPPTTAPPTTAPPTTGPPTTVPVEEPSGTVRLECATLTYRVDLTNPTDAPVTAVLVHNGTPDTRTVPANGSWTETYQLIEDSQYTFSVTLDGTEVDRRTFVANCDGVVPPQATGELSYSCSPLQAILRATNNGQGQVEYRFVDAGNTIKSGTLVYGESANAVLPLVSGQAYDLKVLVSDQEVAAAKFTLQCPSNTSSTTIDPKVLGSSGWNSRNQFDFQQATLAYTGSRSLTAVLAGMLFLGGGAMLYSSSRIRERVLERRNQLP